VFIGVWVCVRCECRSCNVWSQKKIGQYKCLKMIWHFENYGMEWNFALETALEIERVHRGYIWLASVGDDKKIESQCNRTRVWELLRTRTATRVFARLDVTISSVTFIFFYFFIFFTCASTFLIYMVTLFCHWLSYSRNFFLSTKMKPCYQCICAARSYHL